MILDILRCRNEFKLWNWPKFMNVQMLVCGPRRCLRTAAVVRLTQLCVIALQIHQRFSIWTLRVLSKEDFDRVFLSGNIWLYLEKRRPQRRSRTIWAEEMKPVNLFRGRILPRDNLAVLNCAFSMKTLDDILTASPQWAMHNNYRIASFKWLSRGY